MNIDRIFLSGRKRKPSENKNDKSTTLDNENSQSKENPSIEPSPTSSVEFTTSTCDNENWENATVHCKSTTIADETGENDIEREEGEKSLGKIYLKSPIECDDSCNAKTEEKIELYSSRF